MPSEQYEDGRAMSSSTEYGPNQVRAHFHFTTEASFICQLKRREGRGDSPPTNAMSCSDKIALWSIMGIQGALLTSIGMKSVHLSTITIGGVLTSQDTYGDNEFIREDCDRAFFRRVEGSEFEGTATLSLCQVLNLT